MPLLPVVPNKPHAVPWQHLACSFHHLIPNRAPPTLSPRREITGEFNRRDIFPHSSVSLSRFDNLLQLILIHLPYLEITEPARRPENPPGIFNELCRQLLGPGLFPPSPNCIPIFHYPTFHALTSLNPSSLFGAFGVTNRRRPAGRAQAEPEAALGRGVEPLVCEHAFRTPACEKAKNLYGGGANATGTLYTFFSEHAARRNWRHHRTHSTTLRGATSASDQTTPLHPLPLRREQRRHVADRVYDLLHAPPPSKMTQHSRERPRRLIEQPRIGRR